MPHTPQVEVPCASKRQLPYLKTSVGKHAFTKREVRRWNGSTWSSDPAGEGAGEDPATRFR
jgi:hypothetical protein